jgi:hypothetical protein
MVFVIWLKLHRADGTLDGQNASSSFDGMVFTTGV